MQEGRDDMIVEDTRQHRHHGTPMTAWAPACARQALDGITREYPHSPAHPLHGPQDLIPPRTRHPAFYGAREWHTSVQLHWVLLRMLRRFPAQLDSAGITPGVTAALDAHLTPQALSAECAALRAHPGSGRPYGWAWSLTLAAESQALGTERWSTAIEPLCFTVAELLLRWLPGATRPVHHGTHANSSFALGLVLDSAEAAGVPELVEPVTERLREWYGTDRGPGVARREPSGGEFLSPALCEADAMRRVLPRHGFADWLGAFLPELGGPQDPFRTPPALPDPVGASGPADPEQAHPAGLCLSRAAALRGIAGALPQGDARTPALAEAADAHLAAGLPAVGSGARGTGQWLAAFAVLALERDLPRA